MVGTTISHYKVIEKIGQGVMGEVYRAEDTDLTTILISQQVDTVILCGAKSAALHYIPSRLNLNWKSY